MIKEFQQVRNQITKLLLDNQRLQKELNHAQEQTQNNFTVPLLMDLVRLIEQLEKEADFNDPTTKRGLMEQLYALLDKYGVERKPAERTTSAHVANATERSSYFFLGEPLDA